MPTYKYPRPSVTVDAVVFGVDGVALKILLIQRKDVPFKGAWALPGGFVQMGESLDDAARRELAEETGLRPSYMEQLYTFGEPGRDPRGRVITVAYVALVRPDAHAIAAASDARDARWFALDELPALAFDHREIIDMALRRLRAKVRYAPIGFDLLPEAFTLTDLQGLYEEILQTGLDKRNFRKKILSTGLLKEVGQTDATMPPSRLYSFDPTAYARLTKRGFNFEI